MIVPASVLIALGSCVLVGWAAGIAALTRIFPGSTAMAINTAAMFLAAGLGLAANYRQDAAGRLGRIACGGALLFWSLLILAQHVTGADLGIDWASVHQSLGDGHAKPGRTAPNACLGFALSGFVLLISGRGVPRPHVIAVCRWLAALVVVIGAAGFVGYLLQLETLYRVAQYNKMAALTALGLVCAGAGLSGLVFRWRTTLPRGIPDAARVTALAGGLLSVFALSTGLVAFGLLKNSYERSASQNVSHNASKSAAAVAALLDKNVLLSAAVASRPALSGALAQLGRDPRDRLAMERLRAEEQTFLALGYTGLLITDRNGQPVSSVGDPASVPALQAPLQRETEAALLWRKGFMFRSEHDIRERGVVVGRAVLERPMPELTVFTERAQHVSATSDFLICSRQEFRIACFPSRFHPTVATYDMFDRAGRPALPGARALLGERGVESFIHPRGADVLAAYTPIGDYPIAAIEKLDKQELYLPLGEVMPQLLGTVVLLIAGGTLWMRAWLRPIVERIASERARSAAILENSIDAFVALDEGQRITQWNLQAQRLLGWTQEEAFGKPADQLLGVPAPILLPPESGAGDARRQTEARHKDGQSMPVEISLARIDGHDGLSASIFIRDLRDAKRQELLLVQTREELAQAHKLEAIGKLTGGVAHDFNNVLQVIGANLQLLDTKVSGAARALVAAALRAVDRGGKLSSQLLAFARRQPLQPVSFNANKRIAGMDDMLRRSLGERVELETVLAAGLWTTIADPNQLEIVVLNLAINARDAMPDGGKLTIETANCTLDDAYVTGLPDVHPGQYVMVAVTDNGTGMPADVVARAFEPFFTTKPEGEGTGLGLSMAYGFAKQSRGHIRIYSEPGVGTTVKLYLPRSFEAEAVSHEPATSFTGGSETILVVEDDLAVQTAVVGMLQELGYQVLKANDAHAASTILQSGAKVALLFTDVVMPGALRSPELARLAKTLDPQIRVLFTSGYTQNAIVHDGRLDPGVELLSKPYRRDELALKVRRLLDERERNIRRDAAAAHAADQAGEAAAPTQQRPALESNPLRVLLVEDQEDLREATQELLQMIGAQVVAAGSAEEAQRQLAAERFDLLLTDFSLPGTDGLELAKHSKSVQPSLTIAFATGFGSRIKPPPELEATVLTKPFSLEDLQALVKHVAMSKDGV